MAYMGQCDQEVFKNGKPIVALDAGAELAEEWVKQVAKRSNTRLDWHYSGGIASVLHLGDDESRDRANKAIDELSSHVRILRRFNRDDPGLYRAGVSEDLPPGTLAVF